MEAYSSFASVYDAFMDNVPYDKAGKYIKRLLRSDGIKHGLVCELGCGTGNLTERLACAGYDMIGIDSSAEMLELARDKQPEDRLRPILYLQQDMRKFELYGTVRAIVSYCDCVNYITNPEELFQVFSLVNNYLDPNGIFIFDFHTKYYYEKELGNRVIAEDREDMSFIWDNEYSKKTLCNTYRLSFFVKQKKDVYKKFQETHVQRAYTLREIKDLLTMAGLRFEAAYDDLSRSAPKRDSTRIHVVARECRKPLPIDPRKLKKGNYTVTKSNQ